MMDNKMIGNKLQKLSLRVAKLDTLEERLEESFDSVRVFRKKMKAKGFSEEDLKEYDKAVLPVEQYLNEIRITKRRLHTLEAEVADKDCVGKEG